MKYLVHRDTKEHIKYSPGYASCGGEFWHIVEADDEGWIPWNGGECPLPPDGECVVKDRHTLTRGCGGEFSWRHEESNAHGSEWNIIAYRPILAEKEEMPQSLKAAADYIQNEFDSGFEEWLSKRAENVIKSHQSAFDRLRNATEAAESIPAILAEINALLPDGYCVTKREAEPAEDMSDWRNWKEGDLVECINNDGTSLLGLDGKYKIESKDSDYIYIGTINDGWTPDRFRFHSRPKK